MLTNFRSAASIDAETNEAIKRTSISHKVPYPHVLAIIVDEQLGAEPRLTSPDDLAGNLGITVSESRAAMAALHADGWIDVAEGDDFATLAPPHTEPRSLPGAPPRQARPLLALAGQWVGVGGAALSDLALRRLYTRLTKAQPLTLPADVTTFLPFYRWAFAEADLATFLRSVTESEFALRSAAAAFADRSKHSISRSEVSAKVGRLAAEWSRSTPLKRESDTIWLWFAALREVAPSAISRSPLYLSDAIEAALNRRQATPIHNFEESVMPPSDRGQEPS